MCEGNRRSRTGVIRNLRDSDAPIPRRVLDAAVNLARRFRGGRPNDCCGHYGEPGC